MFGFFYCDICVKQWDPMSPLLFYIAKEVHRNINHLTLISKIYGSQSSQMVNPTKYAIYNGSISRRKSKIATLLFFIGIIPWKNGIK